MRRLTPLLLAVTLAGCLTAGRRGNDAVPTVYDFGLLPASTVQAAAGPPLALEVRAPGAEGMGISYRLLYRAGGEVRDYSRARWVATPSQLLQQRLMHVLALQGAGQVRTRCTLRVELAEFAQVFDTPAASRGVLAGRAQLLDATRMLVAERPFRIERPAATPDAPGGVAALQAGVGELGETLQGWLATARRAGCAG